MIRILAFESDEPGLGDKQLATFVLHQRERLLGLIRRNRVVTQSQSAQVAALGINDGVKHIRAHLNTRTAGQQLGGLGRGNCLRRRRHCGGPGNIRCRA
jgi:hypothetical protein